MALEKKPNDPQIFYKRGLSYYKNEEYKNCIKDMFRSLQNKPFASYEADIHYHMGISFANLDLFHKAIEPLTKALELTRTQSIYFHERAKCYLLIGCFQESVEDFTEVLNLQANNSHAYFGRAFAYKALKDYEKSAGDFEKAKELDPANPKLIVNYKRLYDVKYIRLCKPGEEKN